MSVEIVRDFVGDRAHTNGLGVIVGLPIPGMESFGRAVRINFSQNYLLVETEQPCYQRVDSMGEVRTFPHDLLTPDVYDSPLPDGIVFCHGCMTTGQVKSTDWAWRPDVKFDKTDGHLFGVALPRKPGKIYTNGYLTEEEAQKEADAMVAWQASRYSEHGPYWFAVVEYGDAGVKHEIFPNKDGHTYTKNFDYENEPFCEAYAGPYDTVHDALAAFGRANFGYRNLQSVPGITYKGFDPCRYDYNDEHFNAYYAHVAEVG